MRKERRAPRRKPGGLTDVPLEVPENLALLVERIGTVGITEHGEHVGMELQFISGERATVLFPQPLFTRLMAALMAAGTAAHKAQLARLGSEAKVFMHVGAEPFAPTGYTFGRGRTLAGADVLLMTLEKDASPVIDVALGFETAERFAQEMLHELAKGKTAPKIVQ